MASDEKYVSGLSDIQKILDIMPVTVEKNVMRGGMNAGLKPFLIAARENVPVDDGALRKSLRTDSRFVKSEGKVVGKLRAGNDKGVFYARMVEYGTAQHFIAPKNKKALAFGDDVVRGKVNHPGAKHRPFMRPALDGHGNKEAAVKALADYLRKRIYKELMKRK